MLPSGNRSDPLADSRRGATRAGASAIAIAIALLLLFVAVAVPSATANHQYSQPVWFRWNTMELDVLVVGVNDPVLGASIRDGMDRWVDGIQDMAPAWLADGLELRIYFPALDPLPPAGFQPNNINIFVMPQGFMAVNTVNLGGAPDHCIALAPMLAGWGEMAHVVAHEFGHCLGLGHVFNHGNEYSPGFDIMGGGQNGFRSCPSNLNIQVLERVFSGGTGSVTVSAGDYQQANC